jgi:hypothetical protein
MSTYKGEHTIFGLLGQASLAQNDVLQFHPSLDYLLSTAETLIFKDAPFSMINWFFRGVRAIAILNKE